MAQGLPIFGKLHRQQPKRALSILSAGKVGT
jgi:hypothetical protein